MNTYLPKHAGPYSSVSQIQDAIHKTILKLASDEAQEYYALYVAGQHRRGIEVAA